MHTRRVRQVCLVPLSTFLVQCAARGQRLRNRVYTLQCNVEGNECTIGEALFARASFVKQQGVHSRLQFYSDRVL